MRSNRRARIAGAATCLVLIAAFPAVAQRVKDPESELDRLTFEKRELRVSQSLVDSDASRNLANRAAIFRFKAEYGARWRFLIDRRSGHVNLAEGGAIPFTPGPANNLQWQNLAASCRTAGCIPAERIQSAAKEFLARYRGALQVNPDELVVDRTDASSIGNSINFVRFQWVYGGVPVEGGSVFLAVNNGNLIQIGMENIGNIQLDPKPAITAQRAWEVVRAYAGFRDNDEIVDNGTLRIFPITRKGIDPDGPEAPFGRTMHYVLVYKVAFRRQGIIGTWEGVVNAHTGELLRFRDTNAYGHIQGGVYKTDAPLTEVSVPFLNANYGTASWADAAGDFPGLTGTSTMNGNVAGGVRISDGCGLISASANAVGVIDFGGSSGTDCTTPGFGGAGNTHAARTQYWNVTQIKMKGRSYLPGNTWLQGQLQDNVNISVWCNATWNGTTLNFYRSTSVCANTGELPGVSLHEWGHGMDSNDGGGPNRPIEARADWTALLQTHQSCTGSGFFSTGNCGGYGDPCTSCTGIREADWAMHTSNTPWTPQNKGTVWAPGAQCTSGSYFGPCGWEDHCEAGIATQALWDFVNRDLVMDPVSAWQLEDRLFYAGMQQSTNMYTCTGTVIKTSDGCAAGSLYTVMRAIDDDGDGVGNGTPHAAAIYAALNRHAIACGAATDAANQNFTTCPALTTPVLSATATSNQIVLTWTTGGANATRYFVFRNETGCSAGYTRIATVNAPTLTYTDTSVAHGLTYYYRIQAATANDSCVSAMSNCATITAQLPADQDFYVRDWTNTPTVHDNGEEPSTNFMTNWAYTSDVWNRGVNNPGSANASDWFPTDNMYAGSGPGEGDNYGFVRVHRNAGGSAATVNAEFFASEFGAGSNFLPVASTTLTFGTTDLEQTQGAYWMQGDSLSNHACIAVQISTTPDPYKTPGLSGHSPGDPDGQAIILVDNNKAQRNLNVSHNVAHFAGLQYAVIHNGALYRRNIVLRYEAPGEQLQGAQIEVVGGRPLDFRSGSTITLNGMQPGENRWISLRMITGDRAVPIHFYEMNEGRVMNAFTLLVEPAPVNAVIRENLRAHVHSFARVAAIFGISNAKEEADYARRILRERDIRAGQYLAFLKGRSARMSAVIAALLKQAGTGDTFRVLESLKNFNSDIVLRKAEQLTSSHGILLSRLDAYVTMLQKAAGDPADILQTVAWQERIYRTRLDRPDCASKVVIESRAFIASFDARKPEAYAALLRALSECFHQTARVLSRSQAKLEAAATAMEQPAVSSAALQKAHREFLLALQDATEGLPR